MAWNRQMNRQMNERTDGSQLLLMLPTRAYIFGDGGIASQGKDNVSY